MISFILIYMSVADLMIDHWRVSHPQPSKQAEFRRRLLASLVAVLMIPVVTLLFG
jgi:hypothetical protein